MGTPRPGSPFTGKRETPLNIQEVRDGVSVEHRPAQPLAVRSKVQIDPSA